MTVAHKAQPVSYGMNKVILIGGAPTVGKTTVARALSERLKLPWISTDTIREWMKVMMKDTDNYPYLFKFERPFGQFSDPVAYLTEHTAQEIVEHQNKESEEVWPGIKALMYADYTWEAFIVEGIAVLPHLVAQDFADESSVRPLFLIDEDADRIRSVVFSRGLWDRADQYSDDIKEKEVQWAQQFSHWLKGQAEQYDYPVIEMRKETDDLERILDLLK